MNALGFLTPSMAWLAGLAVPLVIFYFLKLRRSPLRVPSLVLWQQVLQDRRVNSPFQRFKRNLLLLVQLLVLFAAVLAAMQPVLRTGPDRARRRLVLLDVSASMAATGTGGGSRLDLARDEVREIIDGMDAESELGLVLFDSEARQTASFTSLRPVLLEALDEVRVRDLPSSLEEALRLAEAMHRGKPFDEAILLSDGNLPGEVLFDLPFRITYRKLPAAGSNIGLTSLSARREPSGAWLFLAGAGGTPGAGGTLVLRSGGDELERRGLVLDERGRADLALRLGWTEATRLEAELLPSGEDALARDNIAWLDLPEARPLAVLADASLGTLRRALAVQRGIEFLEESALREPDLAILSGPGEPPEAAVSFTVGGVPAELEPFLRLEETPDRFIAWMREAALLRHVNLDDVVLLQRSAWVGEGREAALEDLGWRVLAHGERGPVFLVREARGRLRYHAVVPFDRSTLPYRVALPVMAANLLAETRQRAGLAEARAERTGALDLQGLPEAQTVTLLGPLGERILHTDGRGRLQGAIAERTGAYEVRFGGTVEARLGAALLDSGETSLATVDEIRFREIDITGREEPLGSDRPLWPWFALVALAATATEWWLYQRHPGG